MKLSTLYGIVAVVALAIALVMFGARKPVEPPPPPPQPTFSTSLVDSTATGVLAAISITPDGALKGVIENTNDYYISFVAVRVELDDKDGNFQGTFVRTYEAMMPHMKAKMELLQPPGTKLKVKTFFVQK